MFIEAGDDWARVDGRSIGAPRRLAEADHLRSWLPKLAIATEAAQLITAEWEQLGVVGDIDDALAPDAPLIHPENGLDTNAYYHIVIRKDDVTKAFADAAVVIEGTYELPYQEHAYLQPEAALGYVDDAGRITVEIAGQWTHEDQEQIAHALDLAPDQVRVIYPAIGGAFGGREDMSLQIVMALAVSELAKRGIDRPVRSQWTREESIVGPHKRHRGRVTARLAASADGKILGVEADAYLDAGAYNYTSNKVLGNLHLTVAGAYEVPAARIDSYAVYTTTVPGGAFRGFGGPQGCFVAETQMNRLADALGIDPVEIRRRNTLREGSIGITSTPLPAGVSMPEVIDACAQQASWTDPVGQPAAIAAFASLPASGATVRRGKGFACTYKNVGFSFGFPERSNCTIVLHGDDEPTSAEVFLAGAEVGQGAHTAFVQMTAEATGLPVEAIVATFSDTATTGDSGSASASRLSWMTGNAIIGAAHEAEKAWIDGDRPASGSFRYTPPPTGRSTPTVHHRRPTFPTATSLRRSICPSTSRRGTSLCMRLFAPLTWGA
ncbi:MAG: molybdopterin cofactor-binding domain-containing protein [Acidimicrobiales bacterium]